MRSRCLDTELYRNVEKTTADTDDDLSTYKGSRGCVLRAVGQHEAHSQEVDGSSTGDIVLVMTCILDHERDHDRRDCRTEAEYSCDIAGGSEGLALNDLEIRVEVRKDRHVECH